MWSIYYLSTVIYNYTRIYVLSFFFLLYRKIKREIHHQFKVCYFIQENLAVVSVLSVHFYAGCPKRSTYVQLF